MQPPHTYGRRMKFLVAAVLLLAFCGPAQARTTVVSLTFDDGRASQFQTRQMLAAHGMRATFFVNSGQIGTAPSSSHMRLDQLRALRAAGHEIGGHSFEHRRLTDLSAAEAYRQVCSDRVVLESLGLGPVVSFAYPYGADDATTRAIVRACGYRAARDNSGLRSVTCAACAPLETFRPAEPFGVRAMRGVRSTTTLEELQQAVLEAERAGDGWLPLLFHDVCTGCDPDGYWISPPQFDAFLAWLAPRAKRGTVVRTFGAAARIKARVALRSRVRVRAGRAQFSGEVRPARNGARVTLQRRGLRGRWVSVRRTLLKPGRGGASTYRLTIRVRGVERYRVVLAAGPDHLAARGPSHRVRGR